MSHVCNILNISYVVAEVSHVADEYIETDITFRVPEMCVPINRRPANIYPDPVFIHWLKIL